MFALSVVIRGGLSPYCIYPDKCDACTLSKRKLFSDKNITHFSSLLCFDIKMLYGRCPEWQAFIFDEETKQGVRRGGDLRRRRLRTMRLEGNSNLFEPHQGISLVYKQNVVLYIIRLKSGISSLRKRIQPVADDIQ